MYAIWTKLTSIEDVLIGSADEVADYLKTNYFSPVQQINSMFSERAAQLKRNSLHEPTFNSLSFRLLCDSDSSFDSLCEYVGFVLYSYDGKSEFTLNEQQYQRGDIVIEDMSKLADSSTILRSHTRNHQVYNNLYKSFLNHYFKKASYYRFVGLGITYEQYKWKFDAFIIGSEQKRSPFSLEEHRLLEMYILSWMKNMNDQLSIHDNARKILDEQLDYVKGLFETQRSDVEDLWTAKEVDIAIKIFEHESQDEIDALFQTTPVYNTFSHLRNQVQLKSANRLSLVADIFEHRRLTSTTQPSESLLCQVWKQLKTVENWLRRKDFQSLVTFLNSNTFPSIESLFSIPIPLFLDRLGILPESDPFDPTLNYIGLLIYLYNDQNEFTLNKHQCKRGHILIRQKQKIIQFFQAPSYRKTSFAPLFIHEYLYELYFKEKPTELFQGIGFVYEHGKWTFNILTYAGKYGIHSTYDIQEDNRMASSIDEQHSIDLVLSTLYINNKWKGELECMYTIDELETIGRKFFQKEIAIIEELFEIEKTNITGFDQKAFKHFIEQYKPEASLKPITQKIDDILKRSSISQDSQESTTDLPNDQVLINSDTDRSRKSKSTFYPSADDQSGQTQPSPTSPNPSLPAVTSKTRAAPKPNAFRNVLNPLRPRATSQDSSSTSKTPVNYSNSINHTESDEISPPPLPTNRKTRSNSLLPKENAPLTAYQLYKELHDAEQKILYNSDLTQFINYLTKEEYVNYSASVPFTPPDDNADEYNLMAKIKIDSQLEFISELFQLKRSKLFQQQSGQEKKHLDEIFKAFKEHYLKQIQRAKKHSKSK